MNLKIWNLQPYKPLNNKILEDKFNLIFFILFILISAIRKIYLRKLGYKKINLKKINLAEIIMFILMGLAMLSPLIFIFTSRLNFANYYIPDFIRWIGILIFILVPWLLLRSHADLGKNWTISINKENKHTLITNGVYKHIRHPMYSPHLLWALAQLLIIPNWILQALFSYCFPYHSTCIEYLKKKIY